MIAARHTRWLKSWWLAMSLTSLARLIIVERHRLGIRRQTVGKSGSMQIPMRVDSIPAATAARS